MKPIKCLPKENPIYVECNLYEDDIDYKESDIYHFVPEFFEEIYNEPNADILKSANTTLINYNNKRDELTYLGTFKDNRTTEIVEYYKDKDNNYVVFLIDVPRNKRYYPSLQMVVVTKPKTSIQ